MLKKLIAIVISALIICSLVGCNFGVSAPSNTNSTPNDNSSQITSSDNTVTDNSSATSSNPTNNKKPGGNTSQKPIIENPGNNQTNDNVEVSSPEIEIPEPPVTKHTPLGKNSYYHYSSLNQTDKKIYDEICDAIENTTNVVNLKKYKITLEKVYKIYECVTADNPQYFWVTKFLQYTYSPSENDNIIDLFLFYTDGSVTDDIDKNYALTTVASRDKIKAQIEEFNSKVKGILDTIPASYKDIEKEKLIHDYVLKNVSYDYSAVGKPLTKENYSRVYDSYGAICKGKSVCEGYTRMFQWLCYQVGINANFVRGQSDGQDHAWNIVKLDNDWYHVDTTWDDGSTTGLMLYTYFNLTKAQISESHDISSDLPTPNATATKYAFTSTFGMNATNLSSTPQNYTSAIDAMVKFNDSHLIIKLNTGTVTSDYVQTYFLDSNSDIQKYIKSKNYNLRFENSYYYTTDDSGKPSYLYIKRK